MFYQYDEEGPSTSLASTVRNHQPSESSHHNVPEDFIPRTCSEHTMNPFEGSRSRTNKSTKPQLLWPHMHKYLLFLLLLIISLLNPKTGVVDANLWSETARMTDLQQWRVLCSRYQVAQAYMEDSNARITVFAPVNDVFLYNPDLRAMDQKETLSHIIDTQVSEVSNGKKWEKQTLIRSTINSGYVYITQFENNPGNFSYFVNAGMICNHASNQWGIITGEQYLYKTCTPMGHRPYPGTALAFIRDDDNTIFVDRQYDNRDLTELRDILNRVPDIALVIYGSSAWNGFHTFFLPSNKAFAKVIDRNRIDREVLLVHVTGMNRVLFTYSWLYDGGLHYYPTIR